MKTKITISLVLFFAFTGFLFSQNSVNRHTAKISSYVEGRYYVESFEGDIFPPEGWRSVQLYGLYPWMQNQYSSHTGEYCATTALHIPIADNIKSANSINEVSGPYDHPELNWLITPRYTAAEGDSLVFYMSFYAYDALETLSVLISLNEDFALDSASLEAAFTDTLLVCVGNNVGSEYQWPRYSFSLNKYVGQKIYIGFKDCSSDNGNIFLDDIKIGRQPVKEAEAVNSNIPKFLKNKKSFIPVGRFMNNGYDKQSFYVTCKISGQAYSSRKYCENIESGDMAEIQFDSWIPDEKGNFTIKIYAELEGDENVNNDTLSITSVVADALEYSEWHLEPSYSGNISAAMAASYGGGPIYNFNRYFRIFGGWITDGYTNDVKKYDTMTKTWKSAGKIPKKLDGYIPVQIADKVFIAGGREGN
ncbi:MAG TPA: choice-of-anchor J domain-containing protein, partial [Ignavibacteriales bacterium]|nr:choice-of-anchor J domain-containing protein [Ignavibacteriales bacterium]